MALPTTDDELWRYTPIKDLDLSGYALAGVEDAVLERPDGGSVFARAVDDWAALIVIVDGRLLATDLGASSAAAGLTIEASAETSMLDVPDPDALSALHDAFVGDVVVVRVAKGAVIERPIVVVQVSSEPNAASFPHVIFDVGEQAEVTIVDHWTSSEAGGAGAFVSPVVELRSAAAANVRYICVQDFAADSWSTGHLLIAPGRDATTKVWLAALGGRYARFYVDAELADQAATVDIAGVYFGENDQVLDFRSLQDHRSSRTVSNLLLKGAVVDEAHAVYTGMIRVREGAKATESFLANRNLVLADGARVDSVPNLEIVNENDIKSCGHAAATGPVDEEHVFYLESRGVPTDVAQRLIVFGFFDDVVAGIPVPGVHEPLRTAIARKLAKASVDA